MAREQAERAQIRSLLAVRLAGFQSLPQQEPATPSALECGPDDMDTFFGVRRVPGSDAAVFLLGFLVTHLDAVDDAAWAGTSISASDWEVLRRGVHVVFGAAAPGSRVENTARDRTPPPDIDGHTAFARWKTGHRMFYVITQGISCALIATAHAAARGNAIATRAALEAATALSRSAAVAIRFTADFPAEVYRTAVRPRMTPPHAPPGFSGLAGRDHRELVRVYRTVGPVIATLDREQFAASEFRAATDEMFAAHQAVCCEFVGQRDPSLLTRSQGQTAVHVLAGLIRNRRGLLRAEVPRQSTGGSLFEANPFRHPQNENIPR
ncbi:hypothetical protein [Catenulispora yoronensis]|uniref:hypothetical protein n=1 Tax=Catenulispora yoronensis TaxID=450799 RepID=UPI0031E04588